MNTGDTPKFQIFFIFVFFAMSILFCSSNPNQSISDKPNPSNKPNLSNLKLYYPAGESEKILDENGEEVLITEDDFEYFKKPSKDPSEVFRVLITGKKYTLRQIRSSKFIQRKKDPGGDALIVEDVGRFDGKVNFLDDGVIVAKLNPKSGKLENVNFGTRTTRIGDFSKIIQNDSTRWQLEHKTPEPTITKYLVTYYIQLQGSASKDEIKEQLKKEVKK